MITYKDCPGCGKRKIHSTESVCEVCETWAKASAEGFRRGAEAMREACAAALLSYGLVMSRERAAATIRALPIPEEK